MKNVLQIACFLIIVTAMILGLAYVAVARVNDCVDAGGSIQYCAG